MVKQVRWIFDLFNEQRVYSLYKNEIKNNITGNTYYISDYGLNQGAKSYLFKISDIPDFLKVNPKSNLNNFKIKSVRQYEGFLINLSSCASVNDFLKKNLSKRSYRRLRKRQNSLQSRHISYRVYIGNIGIKEHAMLMKKLHYFLKTRFDKKKVHNKYLEKWDYYHQLSYNKINEGNASFFVIYDNSKPICITLNFHLNDLIFSELEGFDSDYEQYNLGDISIFKHIEWCFEHDVKLIDLAMGNTPFKIKWSNTKYHFHYHLHYNKKNIVSLILMLIQFCKLSLLQFLRAKGIIGNLFRYDKFLYVLKRPH